MKGMIPKKYFPQLQHQMAVTRVEKVYYVSYDGVDIAIVEVYRDDEYIKSMIAKEKEFLNRVKTFDAPELTEKDIVVRSDFEWFKCADKYKQLVTEKNFIEKKMEEEKFNLLLLSAEKNCTGSGVTVNKIFRKGNIDYHNIPELEKVDLEKHRKPMSSYWKVSIFEE